MIPRSSSSTPVAGVDLRHLRAVTRPPPAAQTGRDLDRPGGLPGAHVAPDPHVVAARSGERDRLDSGPEADGAHRGGTRRSALPARTACSSSDVSPKVRTWATTSPKERPRLGRSEPKRIL